MMDVHISVYQMVSLSSYSGIGQGVPDRRDRKCTTRSGCKFTFFNRILPFLLYELRARTLLFHSATLFLRQKFH